MSRDQLHLHSNFWKRKREFSIRQTKSFGAIFFATHQRFPWWLRRKLHGKHLHAAILNNMYLKIILLVPVTANLMRRSPVFSCIETAIPSPRHSRCRCTHMCVLHFLNGNWLANAGVMMSGKVNTITVNLVDSTARSIRPGTPKYMILMSC